MRSATTSSPPEPRSETAKRRLAMQKSYSVEHHVPLRRSSLIQDAQFDTLTNIGVGSKQSASSTDSIPCVCNGEFLEEEVFHMKKYTVIFSLVGNVGALSRVVKMFEASNTNMVHMESRPSKVSPKCDLDFIVEFESASTRVAGLLETMRKSAFVVDVRLEAESELDSLATPIWFPRHISDLDNCVHLLAKFEPDLMSDHPGFTDPEYRERRKNIVEIAFNYKFGDPIPTVEYTKEENDTWRVVYEAVKPLHATNVHSAYLKMFSELESEGIFCPYRVPQLEEVSLFMKRKTGFTLRPVAGLLSARDFLASLAFRVFQATQYVRHPSRPEHTVEPDCIHELLGHVPLLCDAEFAEFSQQVGLASLGASDKDIEKYATIYWFSIEFGLCRENGEVKAIGAGLLSSYGELIHSLGDEPERVEFVPDVTAVQPYQDQTYQPVYFVADTFQDMTDKVKKFARTLHRPFDVVYNPYTQRVEPLDTLEAVRAAKWKLESELKRLNVLMARLGKQRCCHCK